MTNYPITAINWRDQDHVAFLILRPNRIFETSEPRHLKFSVYIDIDKY